MLEHLKLLVISSLELHSKSIKNENEFCSFRAGGSTNFSIKGQIVSIQNFASQVATTQLCSCGVGEHP